MIKSQEQMRAILNIIIFIFIYLSPTSAKGSFDLSHDQVYSRKQKCTNFGESKK